MSNEINRHEFIYLDYLMCGSQKKFIGRKEAHEIYTKNEEYIDVKFMKDNEKKLIEGLVDEFGKEWIS